MLELEDLINKILEKNMSKISSIITHNILDELIDYIIFCQNQDDSISPEEIRAMFVSHMENKAGGVA